MVEGTTVQDAPSGDEETENFDERFYEEMQEGLSESLKGRVPVQPTEEVNDESKGTEGEINVHLPYGRVLYHSALNDWAYGVLFKEHVVGVGEEQFPWQGNPLLPLIDA